MQDYVIFHPERAAFRVEGIASVRRAAEQPWTGIIYADPSDLDFGRNEDPYVWSIPWLYSYCHATQLRRNLSKRTAFVKAGSRLFFCDNHAARRGLLAVDTVFVVGERHPWHSVGSVPPTSIRGASQEGSEEYLRHFRHGINRKGEGHRGKYTYTAKHNEPQRSFLPLGADGKALSAPARILKDVSAEHLGSRVPVGQTSHTLALSRSDGDALYRFCDVEAQTRVFELLKALDHGQGGWSCPC